MFFALESRIKQIAGETGFDLCGIAPVREFQELEYFPEWIASQNHGEMGYMESRNDRGELKRAALDRVAPWARSVVVCAINYNTAEPYSNGCEDAGHGWISRYAWSQEDYHDAVMRRLRQVEGRIKNVCNSQFGSEAARDSDDRSTQWLKRSCSERRIGTDEQGEEAGPSAALGRFAPSRSFRMTNPAGGHVAGAEAAPSGDLNHEASAPSKLRVATDHSSTGHWPPTTDHCLQTRCYVDTGPLVERVYAKYAGVGWIGKNTCIINQKLGSWLFLGVILTSLELQADLPAPDRCGRCTRCLDACPTHAFVAPGKIDARLCISYLTIEKRGEIPEHLRGGIGRHVFGCDICQDVCPWNRKAPATSVREFQPREGLVNPALDWLAEMKDEEFRRTFRNSPIRRTKLAGLRRNAVIAMGNSGDQKFLPALKRLSQDPDPVVASHARWAFAQLQSPKRGQESTIQTI